MNITAELGRAKFEWDSGKNASNIAKHGVSFYDAMEVFIDRFQRFMAAEEVDAEERRAVIGMSLSLNLLLVVHTERNDHIRIISARPATRHERRFYERR